MNTLDEFLKNAQTKRTLQDLFIVPDIDNSEINVSFSTPAGATKAKWKVLDEEQKEVCSGQLAELADKVEMSNEIADCKLWNISSPYLYTFEIDFDNGDKESTKFGMRSIKTDGRDILVNNKPFFMRGYIRSRFLKDFPNIQGTSLTEYYEKDIKAAKEYGFNFMRFHSRIPSEECLDVADRLGIFVHVEIRKYFAKYKLFHDEAKYPEKDKWIEAILALRNHPSLMVYCMGNEIDNPGADPFVTEIYKLTKELDPTRLFIDTCARGEFDRDSIDFDVQHMSYFYPFGKDYDMFENTYNWLCNGSCKGRQASDSDNDDYPTYKITRAVDYDYPTIAHEVCHYVAYHDLEALDKKFMSQAPDHKPWWIDELKKLVKLKGYDKFYDKAFKASKNFQLLSWKLAMEAIRRSSLLTGYHFLQLTDAERYENSNGILDCFQDKTGINEKEFLKFNDATVLLSDLPKRTFFENEAVKVPILLSHFSDTITGLADFKFKLKDIDSSEIISQGKLNKIDLDRYGRYEICTIELKIPNCSKARTLKLSARLVSENDIIENDWTLWAMPNRPQSVPEINADITLEDINCTARYQQLNKDNARKLMIRNRFTDEVFKQLENGQDVLMLYRVDENRDRKWTCEKEKYYLPSVWDRLKAVIWDRGSNCGAFIEDHGAFKYFPHDDFLNLQFFDLIDDCDKVNLDDFPVEVKPIMRGFDRAVRDRFDPNIYDMPELEPEWTMRNFAYAFELKVGKGRLFVSSFNFTGLNDNNPATCAMFESILKYMVSNDFKPKAETSVDALKNYLEGKGKQSRIKERTMTQFWQLNNEPLESKRFWKEAKEYIANTLILPRKNINKNQNMRQKIRIKENLTIK
jgi:hypothetical protein